MKIGSVSELTKLGVHTIRYYEKQGLIKVPSKDSSGHRNYSALDVDILNWVSCMKNSGMSLNKIKQYTEAYYKHDKQSCIELLEHHLVKLKAQFENINHYIEVTENKISRFRDS